MFYLLLLFVVFINHYCSIFSSHVAAAGPRPGQAANLNMSALDRLVSQVDDDEYDDSEDEDEEEEEVIYILQIT